MTSPEHPPKHETLPVEIERKFLVDRLPENIGEFEHQEVDQGYLTVGGDGSETRIRRRDSICTLTVKSKGDLVRGEWETVITPQQFAKLWPATSGRRIEKTRFRIPFDDVCIELDVYRGALQGLLTAEVEFLDEQYAHAFTAPEWCLADITTDKRYKNQNLALYGLP